MVFFTRELFDGVQDDSGWSRRANREWERRAETYRRYLEVIGPMLPAAVRQLCADGLHDGVVLSAEQTGDELVLRLDMRDALSRYRGRRPVRLTFRGVRGRIASKGLVGRWWLYEEAHLRPDGRFAVQALFNTGELDVEAAELLVTRELAAKPSGG